MILHMRPLLTLLIIPVLALGMTGCSDDNCDPLQDVAIPSSDKTFYAHQLSQVACVYLGGGGIEHFVTINDSDDKAKQPRIWRDIPQDQIVFETSTSEPGVEWIDAKNLKITVNTVSSISKSAHAVAGVHISYNIPEKLKEENYRKEMEDYQERTLKSIKAHESSFVGNYEGDLKMLKEVIDLRWAEYKKFKAWADENAAQ
jgi:hypothetical protein